MTARPARNTVQEPPGPRHDRPFAPFRPGERQDARDLETIGGLLDVTPAVLQRARGLLTLLGDPCRRTLLERLSRQPDKTGRDLSSMTGIDEADVYHRLRGLRASHVVSKKRHRVYVVDPDALNCVSRYMNALAVSASLTARVGSR